MIENLTHQYRYPGPKPFNTAQQHIFYGRDKDTQALLDLVSLSRITVVFGKSGLGKSSLINAGVVPRIESKGRFTAVNVRFGSYTDKTRDMPLDKTRQAIAPFLNEKPFYLDQLLPNDKSLWALGEKFQAQSKGRSDLLFIFDQFEELFTYPTEHITAFKQAFAELMNNQVPVRFTEALEKQYAQGTTTLTEDELELLHKPFNTKALIAIRSDRLSLLEKLTDALPILLKNMFELYPLSKNDAEQAILSPARDKAINRFISPVFDFTPQAVAKIIGFLTQNDTESIESTQLQIICQSVEKKIQHEHTLIQDQDLGDLEQVIQNYYFDTISKVGSETDQFAARLLIEDGLVFEEEQRRLSLYEGQIYKNFNIQPTVLQKLVDAHLLRAEPSLHGGYTYELSHDTLVAPVLKAKSRRKEAERLKIEQQRQTERAAELAEAKQEAEVERGKRRKATALALAAVLLFLISAITGFYAWQQQNKAHEATLEAIGQKEKAEAAKNIAVLERLKADSLGTIAVREADNALKNFEAAQYNAAQAKSNALAATRAREEAEKNLKAANQQKGIATDALNESERNLQKAVTAETKALAEQAKAQKALEDVQLANVRVVIAYLRDIDKDIHQLQYDTAFEKCQIALALKVDNQKMALTKRVLEIAYFFTETDSLISAIKTLDELKQTGLSVKTPNIKQKLRAEIENLGTPQYFSFLEDRYYPKMLAVEGGEFMMGSTEFEDEKPVHKVRLSPFNLAETEITNWQYNIYAQQKKQRIQQATWQFAGDNPVIYVSWYDAQRYVKWLSEKTGQKYRLPTEAEWEFAAKGGTKTHNYKHSGSNNPNDVAWSFENAKNRTQAIKSKLPNELGLFDMNGNVWEWCSDIKSAVYYKECEKQGLMIDPQGPIGKDEDSRSIRGGSWGYYAADCNSTIRGHNQPTDGSQDFIGFRVALSK